MSCVPELALLSVLEPETVVITMLLELKVPRTKRLVPAASRARAEHWSSSPLPPYLPRHPTNQRKFVFKPTAQSMSV